MKSFILPARPFFQKPKEEALSLSTTDWQDKMQMNS